MERRTGEQHHDDTIQGTGGGIRLADAGLQCGFQTSKAVAGRGGSSVALGLSAHAGDATAAYPCHAKWHTSPSDHVNRMARVLHADQFAADTAVRWFPAADGCGRERSTGTRIRHLSPLPGWRRAAPDRLRPVHVPAVRGDDRHAHAHAGRGAVALVRANARRAASAAAHAALASARLGCVLRADHGVCPVHDRLLCHRSGSGDAEPPRRVRVRRRRYRRRREERTPAADACARWPARRDCPRDCRHLRRHGGGATWQAGRPVAGAGDRHPGLHRSDDDYVRGHVRRELPLVARRLRPLQRRSPRRKKARMPHPALPNPPCRFHSDDGAARPGRRRFPPRGPHP